LVASIATLAFTLGIAVLFGLIFVPIFLLIEMLAPEGTAGFGTVFAIMMPIMYGCWWYRARRGFACRPSPRVST